MFIRGLVTGKCEQLDATIAETFARNQAFKRHGDSEEERFSSHRSPMFFFFINSNCWVY